MGVTVALAGSPVVACGRNPSGKVSFLPVYVGNGAVARWSFPLCCPFAGQVAQILFHPPEAGLVLIVELTGSGLPGSEQ